jgi:hypothetical protein
MRKPEQGAFTLGCVRVPLRHSQYLKTVQMTDKVFYHAAAQELATGIVDAALWTKVTVDMYGAGVPEQQAKYTQLRALELSVASVKSAVVGLIRPIQWVLIGVFALILLGLVLAWITGRF